MSARGEAQAVVLMIRGAVVSLTEEEQGAVKAAADQIRHIVAQAGDAGTVALALVGAEAALDAEGGL